MMDTLGYKKFNSTDQLTSTIQTRSVRLDSWTLWPSKHWVLPLNLTAIAAKSDAKIIPKQ